VLGFGCQVLANFKTRPEPDTQNPAPVLMLDGQQLTLEEVARVVRGEERGEFDP
jgi:hypothetical protein